MTHVDKSVESPTQGAPCPVPELAHTHRSPARTGRLLIPNGSDPEPVSRLCPADHRERSDRYEREILRQGNWRVALCRDGLQWILQRRRSGPKEGATAAWDSIGFCRTRAALFRLWRAHTGEDGAALERLLPAHFKAIRHGR